MFERLKHIGQEHRAGSIPGQFSDPERAQDFSLSFDGMLFDYSKTSMTPAARAALIEALQAADVFARRDAMFVGAPINETEDRAVLHTALRAPQTRSIMVNGSDVLPEVHATLAAMRDFAEAVRDGRYAGQGGAFCDVVLIGIGGSHLGPEMAVRALAPYHDGPRVHFISNVDGADAADCLAPLDPTRTLVIVGSKTFTTIETMTNARTAFAWMAPHVRDPAAQFAALSTALDKTAEFGIPPERVFGFQDWVGGRYSVWGPIGLPVMIAVGAGHFDRFLAGAAAMDAHFVAAAPQDNLPVMLALTGIWHHQCLGYATRAVLPYDQRLARLPAYLQQLEMESNGKAVAMDGHPLSGAVGPVVWGEPGTNGQHAFYQLIHQGNQIVPCEFMVAAQGHEPDLAHHHALLVANCLAQSEALMRGRSLDEARAKLAGKYTGAELERQAQHRVFTGNRPSTTLIYDQLTPYRLGQIIALYEHRVFVEGALFGINSFDQWGVELGKELATALAPILAGSQSAEGKDGSTRMLVRYVQDHAKEPQS